MHGRLLYLSLRNRHRDKYDHARPQRLNKTLTNPTAVHLLSHIAQTLSNHPDGRTSAPCSSGEYSVNFWMWGLKCMGKLLLCELNQPQQVEQSLLPPMHDPGEWQSRFWKCPCQKRKVLMLGGWTMVNSLQDSFLRICPTKTSNYEY